MASEKLSPERGERTRRRGRGNGKLNIELSVETSEANREARREQHSLRGGGQEGMEQRDHAVNCVSLGRGFLHGVGVLEGSGTPPNPPHTGC